MKKFRRRKRVEEEEEDRGQGEKRQMVELTGKRKIQNKREKVEEVCIALTIMLMLFWHKRSTDY